MEFTNFIANFNKAYDTEEFFYRYNVFKANLLTVREHNAKYNFFDGMSPEEITEAQSPLAGWERPSRKFATNGADLPGFIKPMVAEIVPAVEAVKGRQGDLVDLAVMENARANAARIYEKSEIVRHHVEEETVKIVFGRYDLDSGAVKLSALTA